ncbi:MAG: biotin/lipoyl-binding protein [Clostridia bacterium]
MRKTKSILILFIIFSLMFSLLTGCTYFYPMESRYHKVQPELIQQKNIEWQFEEIKREDIFEGYNINSEIGSKCVFINDPQKTVTATSDIGSAKIKKLYVQLNDYVKEGDILVEYEYNINEDDEFKYNWAKRRAEINYENAYIQYQQGKISKQTLDTHHDNYVISKQLLDDFNALEGEYTLRAPYEGYIVGLEGDTLSTEEVSTLVFQICKIEDGFILAYVDENIETAAYPFSVCFENTKAELYDEESDTMYKGFVSMSNTNFKTNYRDDLRSGYFSGQRFLYLKLQFEDNKIPPDIKFHQEFDVKLIKREVSNVLVVSKGLVEIEKQATSEEPAIYYVYKLLPDETVERVYIKVGEEFDTSFEILEGLSEGDMVVVR